MIEIIIYDRGVQVKVLIPEEEAPLWVLNQLNLIRTVEETK